MANSDIKISQLTELTAVDSTDVLVINDASTGNTRRITVGNLLAGVPQNIFDSGDGVHLANGDLKVANEIVAGGDISTSGAVSFGSLIDAIENIQISKFVDLADGISSNNNDTTIPTSAAVIDYIANAPLSGDGSAIQFLPGWVSVVDYGADPTGVDSSTQAFKDCYAANEQKTIYIPKGTYIVDDIAQTFGAGTHWVGESRFKSIIKAKTGFSGNAIFKNINSGSGTTAFCSVENLYIDLNGQNLTGIDLGGVNNTVIEDVVVKGGTSKGTATGIGIKFHAPLLSGSYSNEASNCQVIYLDRGVHWDNGGNHNSFYSGEAISCNTGFDTTPLTGTVDTPRIIGSRVEGCTTGVYEGAGYGTYVGLRIENVTNAWDFDSASDHPQIVGGQVSVVSNNVLNNLDRSDSPLILSSDYGYHFTEQSTSRTIQKQGYHLFSAPGDAYPTKPTPMNTNYDAYHSKSVLLANTRAVSGLNAVGDTARAMIRTDANDKTVLGDTTRQTRVESVDTGLRFNTGNLGMYFGSGSPEGVLTAEQGSLYGRTDGDSSTTLYIKVNGTGNTGWLAK